MSDIFTNRETAVIIWTGIIAIYALFRKQVRTSFLIVIKSALDKHLLLYLISYLFYMCFFTYAYYCLKWWNLNNLKDTAIWFIFSGLQIGYVVVTNKLERGFWQNLILKNLTFVEFEKFFINLYNFSFIVELILVPLIVLIVALNTLHKCNKEYKNERYKNIKKFTNLNLIILGLLLLLYSFYRARIDIQSIANMNTLKSFLLPVAYAIISIPYMYILKLYSEYENLSLMLKLGRKRSKGLNLLIMLHLILFCNFSIKKLQIAANMNNYNLMSISSKAEIDVMIKRYKSALLNGSVESKTAKTRPTWITIKTSQALTATNTSSSETTLQFSDSKKEELVGYMTEFYDAKEVKVDFIPPSNSSNGLIAVDYCTYVTPTKTGLNNNIANILILSESLAKESGILNPNVSVRAMTGEGIQLGIGNYFSSTGKAFIDVNSCP